jgi:hypothetical protein
VHFVVFYCIIILKCAAQRTFKKILGESAAPLFREKNSHLPARSTQQNCPQRSAAADKIYGATSKTTVTMTIATVRSVIKYSKKSGKILSHWSKPFLQMIHTNFSFGCECCVLSGRGLCDELIIRPEESHRLWCVVVCNLTTSWTRSPWPTGEGGASCAKNKEGAKAKISHL